MLLVHERAQHDPLDGEGQRDHHDAVSASAISAGTPRSISPTSVSAANSTITPWAKLKTPDALKISTKPSATSE